MRIHFRCSSGLVLASVAALVAAAGLQAAPQNFCEPITFEPAGVGATLTGDVGDTVSVYLGANTLALVADMDVAVLAQAMPTVEEESLPQLILTTYHAPAMGPDAPAAPTLASFAYPEVTGLADLGSSGRDVPLGDTRFFSMGPGGFGSVLTGRPPASLENWSHGMRTAMSYVRPSTNVQMMLAMEVPGAPQAGDFEGPGMEPRAYLVVDRQTKVDSADLGSETETFGRRPASRPVDEPQTAVAAGLDLGLLPTFLSQMGMGMSIVASRGQQTGNLRIALVGTTELPVDWTPYERPYQHPRGTPVDPLLAMSNPVQIAPTSYGGGRVPGEPPVTPRKPWTPITPVVPEPASLLLLGGAAAVALLRRRLGR